MRLLTVFLALGAVVAGAEGSKLEELPKITLPWGTWEASAYDEEGDFFTFLNVRFGKAPVNELRFQKSVFPDAISDPSEIQRNEGSPCIQCEPDQFSALEIEKPPIPSKPRYYPSEDCLFADLYIPQAALNRSATLPIVVWLYGGGFIFGAKDAGFGDNMPFYDGTGLLRVAHEEEQEFIFIAGNYRLGAYGWLAGPTMEQHATPNAGLWDQRLLLQFVHDYVPLFGGNSSSISLWGESAGAGSIVHHLTSTQPPLFGTALMQSPAYVWQWDRAEDGYPARIFQNFTRDLGCPSSGLEALSCLQQIPSAVLKEHNTQLIVKELNETGLIPFNPAVDGSLIVHLPIVSLARREMWKNVSSLLISHVRDESGSFIPQYIKNDDTFDLFLNYFMRGEQYHEQREAMKKQYHNIWSSRQRVHDLIQDSCFVCNTRFVYDAYSNATNNTLYMMHYDFLANVGAAVHASDVVPTFFRSDINVTAFYDYMHKMSPGTWNLELSLLLSVERGLAKEYQPYLAAFGATGTPLPKNNSRTGREWKPATTSSDGNKLKQVMEAGLLSGWYTDMNPGTTDNQNTEAICGFWRNMSFWIQETARNSTPALLVQDGKWKHDL